MFDEMLYLLESIYVHIHHSKQTTYLLTYIKAGMQGYFCCFVASCIYFNTVFMLDKTYSLTCYVIIPCPFYVNGWQRLAIFFRKVLSVNILMQKRDKS